MFRRLRLVGQNTEDAGAMTFVAETVPRNWLYRKGAVGVARQNTKRFPGNFRTGAGIPTTTGVESGCCIAFVEHDHNRNPLLLVFPYCRVLNLAYQIIHVI